MARYQAEGERMASQLGLIYNGPQMWGEAFLYHTFTDPVTGTTFGARDLTQAKAGLTIKRQLFKMKPPGFPDLPDPTAIMEVFNRDVHRILHATTGLRGG